MSVAGARAAESVGRDWGPPTGSAGFGAAWRNGSLRVSRGGKTLLGPKGFSRLARRTSVGGLSRPPSATQSGTLLLRARRGLGGLSEASTAGVPIAA